MAKSLGPEGLVEARLEDARDCVKSRLKGLIVALEGLKAKIGMKVCLAGRGARGSDFKGKIEAKSLPAFGDRRTGAHPDYPLVAGITAISLSAYDGKGE